jgi:hypothetical protein
MTKMKLMKQKRMYESNIITIDLLFSILCNFILLINSFFQVVQDELCQTNVEKKVGELRYSYRLDFILFL